jgi:hypothetical protein
MLAIQPRLSLNLFMVGLFTPTCHRLRLLCLSSRGLNILGGGAVTASHRYCTCADTKKGIFKRNLSVAYFFSFYLYLHIITGLIKMIGKKSFNERIHKDISGRE